MTNDRILIIDILRGYAMLGVALVNFYQMNVLPNDTQVIHFQTELGIIPLLFFNRAYLIFSFLFGYSLFLFERSLQTKLQKLPLVRLIIYRRLLTIFALGVLQTVFLWWGSILILYAIYGSLIYRFLSRSSIFIKCCWIITLFIGALILAFFCEKATPAPLVLKFLPTLDLSLLQQYYQHGDLIAILKTNLFSWLYEYYAIKGPTSYWPDICNDLSFQAEVFVLILSGYALAKSHFLTKTKTWVFFILGLGASLVYLVLDGLKAHENLPLAFADLISNLAFSILTVCSIALFMKTKLNIIFYPFSLVGKTAFSFYVFHMFIGSLIFYGFKQYQQFSFFKIEGLAVLVFGFIYMLNFFILKKFKIGIMEKILRYFSGNLHV